MRIEKASVRVEVITDDGVLEGRFEVDGALIERSRLGLSDKLQYETKAMFDKIEDEYASARNNQEYQGR